MRKTIIIGILAALAATPSLAAGNAASGQQVFARCAICHNNAKGAGNKIGPDLFGVVGRKAGSEPGFSYSAAMKAAGFVWTNDRLDKYVMSPPLVVPGNKMPFSGLPSATQRADLIAYLDTLK
jgi:cytochrome c